MKINNEISYLSKKVSKLFNLGYGGIDLKFFKNEYYVLEVNSIPSWKSIQELESKNLSKIFVNDFINNMKKMSSEILKKCSISLVAEELTAFKPGNHSIFSKIHGMSEKKFRYAAKSLPK